MAVTALLVGYVEPELSERILEASDRFVIVASDGIWDVVTSSVAVQSVDKDLRAKKSLYQCAEHLVSLAIRKGSGDNVTAIVADLQLMARYK